MKRLSLLVWMCIWFGGLSAWAQHPDSVSFLLGEQYYQKGLELARNAAYENALVWLEKALKEFEASEEEENIINTQNQIGAIHLHRESYGTALRYLMEAHRRALQAKDYALIKEITENLYKLHISQQNYDQALKYYGAFQLAMDSLYQDDKSKAIARLNAEYQLEREKQLLEQKQQINEAEFSAKSDRRRLVQFVTVIGLGLSAVFIVIFVSYVRLIRTRAKENYEAQRQLMVQERMASLGQLTAGIAHEIKNPLNFVNNFAEGSLELADDLLEELEQHKDKIEEDAYRELEEMVGDLRQNAVDIHHHGSRADRIVKSMMDHARGSEAERKMVNLNQLVEENINLAYHGFKAGTPSFNVRIEKELDESLKPLDIIPQDIGRVLLNIMNNACYALHQKKESEKDSYEPVLRVSTEGNGEGIIIRIWDNGPGIPPKLREKIFAPFYTTKPTGSGNTGLGLSISYDIIVQDHQGKLDLNSELGEYTEFAITLPVS